MPPSRSALFSSSARNTSPSRPDLLHCSRRWSANMPSGEVVEIAETAVFLPFLVALSLVAPRALTFLLFFTRLPSSFENLAAANPQQNTSYPLSTLPVATASCRPDRALAAVAVRISVAMSGMVLGSQIPAASGPEGLPVCARPRSCSRFQVGRAGPSGPGERTSGHIPAAVPPSWMGDGCDQAPGSVSWSVPIATPSA